MDHRPGDCPCPGLQRIQERTLTLACYQAIDFRITLQQFIRKEGGVRPADNDLCLRSQRAKGADESQAVRAVEGKKRQADDIIAFLCHRRSGLSETPVAEIGQGNVVAPLLKKGCNDMMP
jgi:hypothetical protein